MTESAAFSDCGETRNPLGLAMSRKKKETPAAASCARRRFSQSYPLLSPVLRQDPVLGITLDGSLVEEYRTRRSNPPALRYYFADSLTATSIQNNRKWACGQAERPDFQFVYLMLPTPCNQRCAGCFMGQDKGRLPQHLSGPYFTKSELTGILSFAERHGAKAIVYGGGGELFTWAGAFDLLEMIASHGLRGIVFTNGTLLSRQDVARLNSLGVVLIISLRDTVAAYHNSIVRGNGFASTLSTIEHALQVGFAQDNRLAVELPVTKDNETRVIEDFLPAMRSLGIIPMVEEYIQLTTSDGEKRLCHSFSQTRSFFERACAKDADMGVSWRPEFGQRMIAQPQCRRPLYSFAIFPSGDVVDCPSHSTCYGNLKQRSLWEIMYSEGFKKVVAEFSLCACSTFYTACDREVPDDLPENLRVLR